MSTPIVAVSRTKKPPSLAVNEFPVAIATEACNECRMARLTAFEVRAGRQCPPQIKKQLLPGIEISGWLPLAGEGKFGRAGMMLGMNRVGLLCFY